MKKLKFCYLLIWLTINTINSHHENLHQYLTYQAYLLFKNTLGYDIPIMQSHVGFVQPIVGLCYDGTLCAGAWQEDEMDPVFYQKGDISVQKNGGVTGTHFWQADLG